MRLDKYLKVSRLVKRRTLAKEISDQGRAVSYTHLTLPTTSRVVLSGGGGGW